jgi:hypothetical protein
MSHTPVFSAPRFTLPRTAVLAASSALLLALSAAFASAQLLDPVSTATLETPRKLGDFHLHGGVYMPLNTSSASAAIGTRVSGLLTPQLSAGLSLDWYFSASKRLGNAGQPLPSSVYTPHQVLGNSVTQLIPAMAFLQLAPWPQAHLSPYAGIGAGYEWLRSSANDYETGYSFRASYSNWAWQSFAGMGIRLSSQLRLDGEAFYNAGQLGRDVHDASGTLGREVVKVTGAGVRCGLNLAY